MISTVMSERLFIRLSESRKRPRGALWKDSNLHTDDGKLTETFTIRSQLKG